MNDRDIKSLLERATTGVEPRSSARATTLRRARRKRVLNGAIAGGLAALVAAGAFFIASDEWSLDDRSFEAAGEPANVLEVPEGEVEIARGETEGEPWLVSAESEDCVTIHRLNATGQISGGGCGLARNDLGTYEFRRHGYVLVAGSVAPDVELVEIRTPHGPFGGAREMQLIDAPDELGTDRRFFVGELPARADQSFVVADPIEVPLLKRRVWSVSQVVECVGSDPEIQAKLERQAEKLQRQIKRVRQSSQGNKSDFTFSPGNGLQAATVATTCSVSEPTKSTEP